MTRTHDQKDENHSFPQKVWITGGIFALITVVLLLIQASFNVLLLILAGVLISVFFRSLAGVICRKTGWKLSACLAISITGTLLTLILLFWLIGAKVQQQTTELGSKLPSTVENAKSYLNQTPLGQKLVQYSSDPATQKKTQTMLSTFFRSTFGVLGDIYVILFISIFFTVSPDSYKKGIVKLVPAAGRKKADEVLDKIGDHLKKWLKGMMLAMVVVFVLTAIGLASIGVKLWLVLALIAGILNFIPNFGPLIAMIPAVLVALMDSPLTAVLVAGLYILVQVAESNFITPMVQKRLIEVPPALIIISQLLMGVLTGGWGLVLSIPLLVVIMVTVQEVYVKKQDEAEKKIQLPK